MTQKKPNSILQSLADKPSCQLPPIPDVEHDTNRAEGLLKGSPIVDHEDTVDMAKLIELAKQRAYIGLTDSPERRQVEPADVPPNDDGTPKKPKQPKRQANPILKSLVGGCDTGGCGCA